MSEWIRDYYDDVDNMRLDELVSRHSDDVVVRFGNNPPARGKEEIAQRVGQFWSMIGGLKHTFVNTFVEASIDYTRADGSQVIVPRASILHRSRDLVDSLRVYVDLAPVLAEPLTATQEAR